MGKKKTKSSQKRAKDARGYATGGGPRPPSKAQSSANASRSKAPAASARAHDGMKDLLGRLSSVDDTTGTASAKAPIAPSDRFASKLSNVVDRLDDLGFANAHVERVVRALGYDIALEGALDWLCLHLPTLELPALFTDGEARRDLTEVTTAESLTVVKEAVAKGAGSLEDNILAVDPASNGSKERLDGSDDKWIDERKEKDEKAREKERLLRQYECEEEEGEGDETDAVPAPDVGKDAAIDEASPEERELAEEERTLVELEADANNDANNYMRSKAEIKALRTEVKKRRQRVGGLRRKVERNKARRRKEAQEVQHDEGKAKAGAGDGDAGKEDEPEAEASGGGFFDIFAPSEGEGGEDEAAAKEEAPPQPTKLLDLTYDTKKWTGSTPQRKLEEVLKKSKLPRARYSQLPANAGVVLSVTLDKEQPPEKWEARNVDFREGRGLRDYLAIRALYGIDPTLPLYQIFPPPFRELWLSWMNQVTEERDRAQREQDDARQERLERLLSLISAMHVGRSGGSAKGSDARDEPEDAAFDRDDVEVVADCWDDESDDDLPVAATTTAAPSQKGHKLQADFARRRATPSYQKMKAAREDLPMASYRSTVLEAVENHPVTILCAETGAGKSTQCAQYILERALLDGRGDRVNLICTQPRRVAATSLAERVADEMCDELGKLVGYQIRMESKRSSHTKLLFCTTGVILRRLQDDPSLSGVTHVLVDEVHERQQQIDVLLVVLRRLLQTSRPDLKVVLMSATLETELFSGFFHGAPVINVPGRTFPVASYYLEDLLDATGHIIEEGSRYAFREDYYSDTASLWVTTRGGDKRKETVDLTSQTQPGEVSDAYAGYSMTTRRSMERVNEEVINFDLIEDVLKLVTNKKGDEHNLVAPDGVDMSKGSILVFLPGLGEIKALMERLDGSRLFRDRTRFDVIPLHSTLSSRDQRRAFVPSKAGCRKIICATNIAETSVTIPDVVCCIDSGRVREVRRNKRTSASMLVTDWCPKSSAKQRQGRAGRVQPGICLKLYSSTTAERVMKATNEPELRRVPLEEVCICILSSGFAQSCKEFLDQAPEPPSEESVQSALNVLYDVGAIDRDGQDGSQQTAERLTPLGCHLAKLPVDVKLGKLLIYGCIFRCIDPILTIAATLSASKSPFAVAFDDAAVAEAKQRAFANPDSDFLTYCNVWEAYNKATAASASAGRRFCRDNYLNHIALREIEDARRQFFALLCGIGFLDRYVDYGEVRSSRFNHHAKRAEVVHSVTCAGLYPNVARLEQTTPTEYSLYHNNERIYFHKSSVNGSKKRFSDAERWLVFHEKFGTPNRTSVSTTAFVHPFALLLFGGAVVVRHTERTVIVDQNRIGMPAQTGVVLQELRKKIDVLLQRMIECADVGEIERLDASIIDGIIDIIAS